MGWRRHLDTLTVFSNRQPWLALRIALWVLTAGWVFLLYYTLLGAAWLLATIAFLPFAWQIMHLAIFTFNPVALEPAHPTAVDGPVPLWRRGGHPYTIAANVMWLLMLGWPAALMHLAFGFLQALTVVGIPTFITNVKLARFVLWPFPFEVRTAPLPRTLEELYAVRHGQAGQFETQLQAQLRDGDFEGRTRAGAPPPRERPVSAA